MKYSRKYVYFYAGNLLVHKIKLVIDDRYYIGEHIAKYYHKNPYVKGNRLYVYKAENNNEEGRLCSYPMSHDVLYELKKMKRKVITEKVKMSE